jgi:copper chaperone CopZ
VPPKVATAVRTVAGVTDVRVDLSSGRITVAGTATGNQIHAAVTDAGYTITNP